MVYKDIAEYEETDSQLAISTIINLHTKIDKLNKLRRETIRQLQAIQNYVDNE